MASRKIPSAPASIYSFALWIQPSIPSEAKASVLAMIKKSESVLPSTALLILSHISFDEINFLFGLCPHLFASI